MDPKYVGEVYAALASRRTSYDSLMWQIPGLAVAADSFLLTIALRADTTTWIRILTAGFALIVALIASQTMAKHRANERSASRMLESIEIQMMGIAKSVAPHRHPELRAQAVGNELYNHWWVRCCRSYSLWQWALRLFCLAAFALIIIASVSPGLLKSEDASASGRFVQEGQIPAADDRRDNLPAWGQGADSPCFWHWPGHNVPCSGE